jgi:outer membrane lipoprotein SlyB
MTPPAPPTCRDCGTVEAVRGITEKGQGTGLGAVAGGVLGGVLGHQVGSGRGNDLATVAGAVGGAVAGHQIEKQQRKTTRHEITIHMDDGSVRTIMTESQPSWRAGERVKVSNGTIVPIL